MNTGGTASAARTIQPRWRPYPDDLQASRVSAHAVQRQSRHNFGIAIVKDGASGVNFSDHLERVLQVVRFAQKMVTHASTRGVSNLAILDVISRGGKSIEIAGMIVMQVSEDHVGDFIRIDPEQPQRLHWTAQMLALAADGRLFGESGVDHEHAIAAANHPHEVVQVRSELVRIGQDITLSWMAISEMAVANGEYFKWFHSGRIDHYNVQSFG